MPTSSRIRYGRERRQGANVTRADLAGGHGVAPMTRREGRALVDDILEDIAAALVRRARPPSGFGKFSVRQKGPRIGRNPKTKVRTHPPQKSPVFRPSHHEARVAGLPSTANKACRKRKLQDARRASARDRAGQSAGTLALTLRALCLDRPPRFCRQRHAVGRARRRMARSGSPGTSIFHAFAASPTLK